MKEARPKELKYQFVVRVLSEKLALEEKGLGIWKNRLTSTDLATVRQAQGNIPSTEHRIKELKDVLELMNPTPPKEPTVS